MKETKDNQKLKKLRYYIRRRTTAYIKNMNYYKK